MAEEERDEFAYDLKDVIRNGSIKMLCGAPAPLVVNGGHYVGCQKPADHTDEHEVKISWAR